MPKRLADSASPESEWEQLDADYNLDEGGGKVRGIYTQGNYEVDIIFSQWIAPLKDLGVVAVTNRSDSGADHESFDNIALPGFNFLQDELNYHTRTHHSNLDTVDHLHAADLEQAAIVEAIFLWNRGWRDAMMPRKPFPLLKTDQKRDAPIPGLFPDAKPEGIRSCHHSIVSMRRRTLGTISIAGGQRAGCVYSNLVDNVVVYASNRI